MSKSSARILVVDDDPEIMTLLSTRLSKRGYKMSTAGDGTKALEVARREMPDVMILDVMMPGKSGWEVMRALKQDPETEGIKILILTAMGKPGEITAPIMGADAYVDKPFDFDEIERIIGELLAKK